MVVDGRFAQAMGMASAGFFAGKRVALCAVFIWKRFYLGVGRRSRYILPSGWDR